MGEERRDEGFALGVEGHRRRARVAQRVDELQDPEHVAARVPDRHRQHRARPVAVQGVQLAVELVRSLQRDLVHVGDVDAPAGERDVPGDTRVVESERLCREAPLGLGVAEPRGERVVLRRREAEQIALAEIDRAGVRPSQAPRFGEEPPERALGVGLRRKRLHDPLHLVLLPHSRTPSRPGMWRP